MKSIDSKVLFDKYFGLSDRHVRIVLRNGKVIQGTIAGYSFQDPDADDPVISRWHLVRDDSKETEGYQEVGFVVGEMVRHCDIASVFFREDHSTMTF